MALTIHVEPTPNENSLKFVLNQKVGDRSKYFVSVQEAAGNPLAMALFDLGYVTGVMISGNFVSVNKKSELSWPPLIPAIQEILRAQIGA